MDLGSFPYRAGLFVTVLLLLGIFTDQMGLFRSGMDAERVEDIALCLSEGLMTLLSSGGEGELTINLGTAPAGQEGGIDLPGRIDGTGFRIRALPGLMTLEYGSKTMEVLSHPYIIPSFRPVDSENCTTSMCREIGRLSGGFSMTTPCSLTAAAVSVNRSIVLFIAPYSAGSPPLLDRPETSELITVIRDNGIPMPGWERSAEYRIRSCARFGYPILILDPIEPAADEGWCGIPIALPPNADAPPPGDPFLGEGAVFTLMKEAVRQDDGNWTVMTRITLS